MLIRREREREREAFTTRECISEEEDEVEEKKEEEQEVLEKREEVKRETNCTVNSIRRASARAPKQRILF